MKWRFVLALIWVAAGGCADELVRPPSSVSGLAPPSGALPEPPVFARAQKTDSKSPPDTLLDQAPDRPAGLPRGPAAASIRATVNGEAILDEEVRAAAAQGLSGARNAEEQAEIIKEVLNHLIDREILYQEAAGRLTKGPQGTKMLDKLKEEANKDFDKTFVRRVMKDHNFKTPEELSAYLSENGMSLELMRRSNERQFIAMEYLRYRIAASLARIGHLQIVEYYDKHPEEFQVPDSVQWQDLFIDALKHPSREAARAFAEVLAGRIRKGEDFVRLAQEYDNGDSQYRKYEGMGHKRGEIRPPEAEKVLFGMKDGELSLVEIGSGFHVVRLVKRVYAGPMPFDDKVQKQIRDKLRGEVFQREMKRIIRDLRSKAVVQVSKAPD
jgi:parvulin-like peptidyl-prolyl isomerase